jgi:hypothetical protein
LRDPGQRLGVEQQHAAGEPLAQADVVVVELASLRIQEGRLTIVEIAEQLGHSPAMTLRTYAHVIDEFRGGGKVDPDELIADARAAVKRGQGLSDGPQMDPTTQKAGASADLREPKSPMATGKPSAGLEPATPSLPWNSGVATGVHGCARKASLQAFPDSRYFGSMTT